MDAETLAERYLAALEAASLPDIAALFTADGVVVSPLYGTMPAADFYAALFADTNRSDTTLLRVLTGPDGSAALHFRYRWTLSGGKVVTFEVVDIVELEAGRIAKLTILYDTAPLRAAHTAARSG
ncbi:MAG: nuclear transport factor 2 family protein [Pseudomonadota bacterium]